jgi:hypothetical protein
MATGAEGCCACACWQALVTYLPCLSSLTGGGNGCGGGGTTQACEVRNCCNLAQICNRLFCCVSINGGQVSLQDSNTVGGADGGGPSADAHKVNPANISGMPGQAQARDLTAMDIAHAAIQQQAQGPSAPSNIPALPASHQVTVIPAATSKQTPPKGDGWV